MCAKRICVTDAKAMEYAMMARELAEARERASRTGTPTYYFQVGNRVQYGAWPEATISKVLDDGKVYLVHAESTNRKGEKAEKDIYQCWTSIRPLEHKDTQFSNNDDIRLIFSNSTIESLLFSSITFGINFSPDYQREYVWEDSDCEALLESVFMGADIGRFVLRKCSDEEWREHHMTYEIIDGKQRLMTLLNYYENRFPYKGAFYNDLSPRDRRKFNNHSISVAEVAYFSQRDTLRLFLLLNRGGRPVSDAVIQRAQQMLAAESAELENSGT